jgi:DNA-binding response OmpR family regulator
MKGRVLLVDNEVALGRVLTLVLRQQGYEVSAVQSASAGKDRLVEGVFDCLVLDYWLPDLRGDVLYAFAVAYQPRLKGRALFLTGDITDEVAQRIAATGSVWLRKPFELTVFVEMVGWLMEGGGDEWQRGAGGAQRGAPDNEPL